MKKKKNISPRTLNRPQTPICFPLHPSVKLVGQSRKNLLGTSAFSWRGWQESPNVGGNLSTSNSSNQCLHTPWATDTFEGLQSVGRPQMTSVMSLPRFCLTRSRSERGVCNKWATYSYSRVSWWCFNVTVNLPHCFNPSKWQMAISLLVFSCLLTKFGWWLKLIAPTGACNAWLIPQDSQANLNPIRPLSKILSGTLVSLSKLHNRLTLNFYRHGVMPVWARLKRERPFQNRDCTAATKTFLYLSPLMRSSIHTACRLPNLQTFGFFLLAVHCF